MILDYTTETNQGDPYMLKRIFSFLGIVVLVVVMTGMLTAAAPMPEITLVQGLPETLNVGQTYTVIVEVTSEEKFISAQAMPSFYYPGKGVVAVQGGDRAGQGNSALLEVTFKAKSPTTRMTDGVALVYLNVGVRYGGGDVVVMPYEFRVKVP
jgi:hypothetical protein